MSPRGNPDAMREANRRRAESKKRSAALARAKKQAEIDEVDEIRERDRQLTEDFWKRERERRRRKGKVASRSAWLSTP